MNITITLNEEQQSALEDLLADYNASRVVPVDAETYLSHVLAGTIEERVELNFDAAANALVAASRSLPIAARRQLIAEVQAKING